MANTPRITRRYYSRIPVFSTRYPSPANWLLVHFLDVLPILLVALFVPWQDSDLYFWLMVLAAVWFLARYIRRRRSRARWCAEHGHPYPYQPVPEVDEWRCRWCGERLNVADPQVVATSVAAAASEIDLLRRGKRPQSYYSDRR